MVKILAPQANDSIYDPACGTGGMILEALHYVKEQGGDEKLMLGHLYGQEKNLTTSAIARMNLFFHGAEDFHIKRGDTLRHPAFYSGDSLSVFDCVIANPPFSLKNWGDDIWINDPYGRNFAGLPPAKTGDFAWVQHMIKSMSPKTGRMAVVLPHGVLFRMAKEGKIRRKLLEMDILEAIIGLGPNLFYGNGLAACILVFRETKGKITGIGGLERISKLENELSRGLSPSALVSVEKHDILGKEVLVIEVPAGKDIPYAFRDQIYIRTGDITRKADIETIKDMVVRRQVEPERWERRFSIADIESDLDVDEIADVVKAVNRNLRMEFQDEGDMQAVLQDMSVFKYGHLTNGGGMFSLPRIRSYVIPRSGSELSVLPPAKRTTPIVTKKPLPGHWYPSLRKSTGLLSVILRPLPNSGRANWSGRTNRFIRLTRFGKVW